MMRLFLLWIVVAVATVALSTEAEAGYRVPQGEPIEGGSWSQSWLNPGPLDFYRIDWVAGNKFGSDSGDYITAFSKTGWALEWGTPTSAAASGPGFTTGDLQTKEHYQGSPSDFMQYKWTLYYDSQWQYSELITRQNNNWSYQALTQGQWDPGTTSPIPEPGYLGLIALGLSGVALFRARATKK